MMAEVELEMAGQPANLREMERVGGAGGDSPGRSESSLSRVLRAFQVGPN
jgi:hypothetical protein